MKQSSQAEGKRVGIWIRVSTEDQAQGESPEHHERRARYYAEAKGWAVIEVYDLAGVSGKSVMDHPEARRMMADIRRGHITGLVFSKLARLARSTRELLEMAEYFHKYQADLVSLGESIDTSTPAGRLFYTILAAMAQWEREEIAERIRASVPIRAKLGKRLGAAAPFGYRWQNNQMVPDPQEAPVRRLMYELFAEHRRIKTVVRLLNQAGHRTRKGQPFTYATVERLILDSTAKGERRANFTTNSPDRKKRLLKPESEWVIVPVEPVVSAELWERCNEMLSARVRRVLQRSKKPKHLFSGLVYCACGAGKMYPTEKLPPRYTCRTCRRKIRTDDLEIIFAEQLRAFVFSPEQIRENIEQADAALVASAALLETLRTERAGVAREMDKLYQLYLGNHIAPAGFAARNRPLEERLGQLDARIPELQAEIDVRKIQLASQEEVVSEAQTLTDGWADLGFDERRVIVESITRRITVGEEEVDIELEFLRPFDNAGGNGLRNLNGPKSAFADSHARIRTGKPSPALTRSSPPSPAVREKPRG